MKKAPKAWLALLIGVSVLTLQPASRPMVFAAETPEAGSQTVQKATLQPVAATAADIPFDRSELQTEQDLLMLANQSRSQAGAPPLQLDSGLSQAARIHAQAMLDARQLSHQFQGEPSLPSRLAASTRLQLDQEAENVALDYDAEHGHEHLMLSPPHRANLLNPAYNVIGLGVVRSGDRLYIVEDFGRALPVYPAQELKNRIATAVKQARQRFRKTDLSRHDLIGADDAACSMAQADRLGTAPVRNLAEHSTVLTYTSLHPETLPREADHALSSRNLHSFSVGTCYARTATYPTGVYWVVLSIE